MGAHRAGRDVEGGTYFLVRFSLRDHPRDLELTSGEARHSRRDRTSWRSCSQCSQLVADVVELAGSAETRERIVRNSELAHRSLSVAPVLERPGEHAPDSGRLVGKWDLLQRVDRRAKERNRILHVRITGG